MRIIKFIGEKKEHRFLTDNETESFIINCTWSGLIELTEKGIDSFEYDENTAVGSFVKAVKLSVDNKTDLRKSLEEYLIKEYTKNEVEE